MTELQKLALRHVEKMAEEIGSMTMSLGRELNKKDVKFQAEIHTYPIHGKANEISLWTRAIRAEEK